MQVQLNAKLKRVIDETLKFGWGGDQVLPNKKYHTFESIKQHTLLDSSRHQYFVYQKKFDFLAVVGLLNTFHGEGKTQEGQFNQQLRFKTLIRIDSNLLKSARDIIESKDSDGNNCSSLIFLLKAKRKAGTFLACDFLNPLQIMSMGGLSTSTSIDSTIGKM